MRNVLSALWHSGTRVSILDLWISAETPQLVAERTASVLSVLFQVVSERPVAVRQSEDPKSDKIGSVSPGLICDVVEIGGTNKAGRSRLRIASPSGWVSDRNKQGQEQLREYIVETPAVGQAVAAPGHSVRREEQIALVGRHAELFGFAADESGQGQWAEQLDKMESRYLEILERSVLVVGRG